MNRANLSASIDRNICRWFVLGDASVSRGVDLAIIGQVGFVLVGDVLYVRLLCPCKRVRGAA